MSVRNKAELLSALERGDFDAVLGTAEGDWVDFKKQPYSLNEERGRWELAKDVASFANAEGGVIVLGFKTEQIPTELEEKAAKYEFIPKSLVDRSSHHNALARYVFPDLIAVRLAWFPEESEAGILVIDVPRQSQRDRPFIVNRVLGESGNPTIGIGIPRREGSDARWARPERLHALLSGRWSEDSAEALSSAAQDAQANTALLDRAEKRLNSVSDAIQSSGGPAYILQAVPPGRSSFIRDLHDAVREGLERPASLRGSTGFNLKFAGPLEAMERGLANLGGRHAIWVDRDGLFTYGVNAGPDFLGWGVNERRAETEPSLINSLALVESTLEFFRAVYGVLGSRAPPGRWRFRVAGRGWQAAHLALTPGVPEAAWTQDARPASQDDFDEQFDGEGSATRDAVTALEIVYGVFGLAPSEIPFIDNGTVSEDGIRARSRF